VAPPRSGETGRYLRHVVENQGVASVLFETRPRLKNRKPPEMLGCVSSLFEFTLGPGLVLVLLPRWYSLRLVSSPDPYSEPSTRRLLRRWSTCSRSRADYRVMGCVPQSGSPASPV
jgi:hypothetical protein